MTNRGSPNAACWLLRVLCVAWACTLQLLCSAVDCAADGCLGSIRAGNAQFNCALDCGGELCELDWSRKQLQGTLPKIGSLICASKIRRVNLAGGTKPLSVNYGSVNGPLREPSQCQHTSTPSMAFRQRVIASPFARRAGQPGSLVCPTPLQDDMMGAHAKGLSVVFVAATFRTIY